MISRLQTAFESLQLGRVVLQLPAAIADEGPEASKRFFEFFTANIRNKNTREAYGRAVRDFFAWCDRVTTQSTTA